MGRAPCCDKAKVKRGPWSPEEDAQLKDFMAKFGICRNWIALPQKAGLKRCGKSCRLRWLNYLRPNIKHGKFSHQEDQIISSLYATIGSRWSIIAAQLPGRTDNDIKNYWNTKLKKKLMGMIPSKYSQLSFPNTFQTHSLYNISHLYNSFHLQTAAKSPSLIQSPQNLFYCNNPDTFSLTTSQHPYHSQNQEGLQYCHDKESNNMLVFGGNEASCSSSDGSYGKYQVKREDFRNFCNGFDEENQRLMLDYGMSGVVDQSRQLQCELDEVKQLICSGDNYNVNSSSFLFNHDERELQYY